MKSSYKKGQMNLQGLYGAVLLFVTIGIMIGIGIFILQETADATSTTAFTVVNESHTISTIDDVNGVALTGSSVCGSQLFVITTVINDSNTVIVAANYTVGIDNGLFGNLTGDSMGGTEWNITYTYTGTADNSTTSSCRALTTVGTGIGGFADWIAVIIVALAAAIVLGIVINSFGRRESV